MLNPATWPDYLRSALRQYAALAVLKYIWGVFFEMHGVLGAAVYAIVPGVMEAMILPGYLLYNFGSLATGQWGVVLWISMTLPLLQLWVVLKPIPQAVAGMFRSRRAGELDARRLARPWWKMLVLMAGLTFYTVSVGIGFVGSLITANTPYAVLVSAGYWPLWISLVLIVLGALWGNEFNRSTRQIVAEHFGATFLADDHELTRRVHALSDKLSLPPPSVGYMKQANAFAIGPSPNDAAVVLGIPLLRELTHEELDAVIGHELGHIVSRDMRQMQFAVGYQRFFGDLFSMSTLFLTRLFASTSKTKSGVLLTRSLGEALKDIGGTILFVGGELACKSLSRRREFYADAIAAGLTSPGAMVGALNKIEAIDTRHTPAENRYAYLMLRGKRRTFSAFATHPSMDRRRAALNAGTYLGRLPRKPSVWDDAAPKP